MGNKSNPARKQKYADQKAITEKNRVIKRKRHVKKYPNDLQTAKLVEGV
jgi:hypothetical protein